MASWTPPVRNGSSPRRNAGGGALASVAAALLTLGVTVFALMIAAAVLLPAPYGLGAPIGAMPSPSASPAASAAVPGASAAPRPSGTPIAPPSDPIETPAASPTAAPRVARIRASAPVLVDGRAAGRVTVQAVRAAEEVDAGVGPDERLLVATVRLTATARLAYDAADWQLEDDVGERWDPEPDASGNPLGSGTLRPSATRTGTVAFVVPRDRDVRSVILTDGVGTDLVVFARPQPSN